MKMHFFHSFHNVWKLITSQPSERQEKKRQQQREMAMPL